MRIRLDSAKCQGHMRCWDAADDMFDSDDLGNAVLIGDGEVPPGREAAAELAEANCPERAITLER